MVGSQATPHQQAYFARSDALRDKNQEFENDQIKRRLERNEGEKREFRAQLEQSVKMGETMRDEDRNYRVSTQKQIDKANRRSDVAIETMDEKLHAFGGDFSQFGQFVRGELSEQKNYVDGVEVRMKERRDRENSEYQGKLESDIVEHMTNLEGKIGEVRMSNTQGFQQLEGYVDERLDGALKKRNEDDEFDRRIRDLAPSPPSSEFEGFTDVSHMGDSIVMSSKKGSPNEVGSMTSSRSSRLRTPLEGVERRRQSSTMTSSRKRVLNMGMGTPTQTFATHHTVVEGLQGRIGAMQNQEELYETTIGSLAMPSRGNRISGLNNSRGDSAPFNDNPDPTIVEYNALPHKRYTTPSSTMV